MPHFKPLDVEEIRIRKSARSPTGVEATVYYCACPTEEGEALGISSLRWHELMDAPALALAVPGGSTVVEDKDRREDLFPQTLARSG